MPAKASAPPSIYENMAGMASSPPPPPGGATPPGAGAGAGAGGAEEKKQIVMTLLEVGKKWDKLEQDQAGKAIIQQMMDLVKKYQTEVLKEGGPKDAAAASGDAGAGMPPPPPGKGDKAEPVPA
jgi:hypothetical protein